ncbi:MAG: LD-carboxypeptidase [Bacteroidales bacterium]|nr:LD-carboxypeptidase [Bacteroidales bacterium]
MKHAIFHILACAFVLTALSCDKDTPQAGEDCPLPETFTAPAFLQKGDKVAVIVPSFWMNEANVEQLCSALEEWELVPVLGAHVGEREPYTKAGYAYYGGSAEARAEDLRWALEDKSVKAIIVATGGYGAIHLLDMVPQASYRAAPKWLVGFDDATLLLSASLLSGTMCLHGPMGAGIAVRRLGESEQALRRLLFGEVPEYVLKAHSCNSPGHAEGRLVGGDIFKLRVLAGTTYDIGRMDDIILFLEGSGASYSELNCAFNTLMRQGRMDHVKGIIFGRVSGNSANLNNYSSAEQMLSSEYTSKFGIPVCFGFEAGDGVVNNPLVFGAQVTLDVSATGASLRFQL